jgi:hypothetical protein
MKYLLLSLVLLFGLSDVTYSQSRTDKFKAMLKRIEEAAKKAEQRKGRSVPKPQSARGTHTPSVSGVKHMKDTSKTDFMNGTNKQLIIPYADGLNVKFGVGNYTKVKNGYRYVIARNTGISADGETYDRWKKRMKW